MGYIEIYQCKGHYETRLRENASSALCITSIPVEDDSFIETKVQTGRIALGKIPEYNVPPLWLRRIRQKRDYRI